VDPRRIPEEEEITSYSNQLGAINPKRVMELDPGRIPWSKGKRKITYPSVFLKATATQYNYMRLAVIAK
jgi:hypothetical protein